MEQTEIWLAPGSVPHLTRHLDDFGKKTSDSPSTRLVFLLQLSFYLVTPILSVLLWI